MKRVALLMLVLALFAPQFALAAHLADHDLAETSARTHVHHSGHAHEHHDEAAGDLDAAGDHADEDGTGFVHEHPPSLLVAFAALLPEGAEIAGTTPSLQPAVARVSDGISLPPPRLPHRPPRRA